jgi:hypothetical protein
MVVKSSARQYNRRAESNATADQPWNRAAAGRQWQPGGDRSFDLHRSDDARRCGDDHAELGDSALLAQLATAPMLANSMRRALRIRRAELSAPLRGPE